MGQPYSYFSKQEKNIVEVHHIYGPRVKFYYFVIMKTLNLGNVKRELVYLEQY